MVLETTLIQSLNELIMKFLFFKSIVIYQRSLLRIGYLAHQQQYKPKSK